MATNAWIVDAATNLFKRGGFCDVTSVDGTELLVVLPDETMPDVINERYDARSASLRRPATLDEQTIVSTQRTRTQAADLVAAPQFQAAIQVFAMALGGATGQPLDVAALTAQIEAVTVANLASIAVPTLRSQP